jgi:hypothetical protein
MGKKSRRQREKDPVNEMVKYQARQTGEGKQQALRRMKEALNSTHPRSAPSVAPAPNVARDDDDDDEPAPALSGVDNAKIILVQVLGGIGRQDVLDANLEKQLRLLTDDAGAASAGAAESNMIYRNRGSGFAAGAAMRGTATRRAKPRTGPITKASACKHGTQKPSSASRKANRGKNCIRNLSTCMMGMDN